MPEIISDPEFELHRQLVRVISAGQGDTEHSTIFHIPSAEAVVAGDIVYNNVHLMQFETNEAKRESWIASLDAIAALEPKIVVAGHKRVGAPDLPEDISASQQYLRLHPDRQGTKDR